MVKLKKDWVKEQKDPDFEKTLDAFREAAEKYN